MRVAKETPPREPAHGLLARCLNSMGGAPGLCALILAALLPTAGLMNGPIYAPLIFAAAIVGTILAWRRGNLAIDLPLAALMAAFITWCWLSLLWTMSPPRTLAGDLQVSFVLPAALLFLPASRLYPPSHVPLLALALSGAILAGLLLLGSDRLDGFRLLHLLNGAKTWPTKYNRGIDHAALLAFPIIGYWTARRRFLPVAVLALALALLVASGSNTTAQAGLPAAFLVAALAMWAPQATALLLATATCAEALLLPFAMQQIDRLRPAIAQHIKISGVERLEIWDYLSAHALQRPLTGWGLWTSRLLPATAAEKAQFIKATGSGIYAHNHWLELWVELGLPGVLLGLSFAALVLRRAVRSPLAPFALAAYSFALAVASSGFEVTTDSWWAALACSAALFGLFCQTNKP